LIWSNEHNRWWVAGGWGYTAGLSAAGHFSREQAIRICRQALPTAMHIGRISEIPVRLADLDEILKDQLIPRQVFHGD
jgi:hypothetical protein